MAGIARKLNIAVLIKSFVKSGGSQRYAAEIARRLLSRGHRIDLYTREVDEELAAGMTLYRVPEKLMYFGAIALYTFNRETARLLTGKKYDIIHTHERGFIPCDIATQHSFSFRGSGYMAYPLHKKILQVYTSPLSWLHLWLEGGQLRAPHLVAVSRAIREDTARYYGRARDVSVIPPGVDLDFFHPDQIGARRQQTRVAASIGDHETVVLFVGSEFRRKGLDLLIPAIGPGMRLVVVGRGERLSYYRNLAVRHGIADRLVFAGLSDDVRQYYAMADVLVLPSRSEAFGMSVLEAMACGLPVVTSVGVGVADLIEDGGNGFLFRESGELGAVLKRAAAPASRQAIGERARQTAENYSWDRAADAYEELMLQVAVARRGEGRG